MSNEDRRTMLEEALQLIEEAKNLVDSAVEGTKGWRYYISYGSCGLERALGNGNPYDDSIPKLIENFEGGNNGNIKG